MKKKRISSKSSKLLFFLLCFPLCVFSQTVEQDSLWLNEEWYFSTQQSAFIDLTQFLPAFLKNEAILKRYLRDERFYDLRKQYDDSLAVDAIYDRAMLITDDNIGHALLIATFAVMDHRQIGLRIPLLGSVYVPLTFENDSLFRLRRTHLPKKLLDDKKRASDKDKLQHFFGSAYIAYKTNSNAIANWVGDLLEIGEDRFVQGGRSDERDMKANAKGREFGLQLLRDPDLLPSDVLWK